MKTLTRFKRTIFIILILSFFQSNAQSNNFKSERTKMAIFNIGFNGLVGGFGSLINKKDGDKNLRLLMGFIKAQ